LTLMRFSPRDMLTVIPERKLKGAMKRIAVVASSTVQLRQTG